MEFPRSLHIATYDMRGTVVDSGLAKPCRQTGLVVHTHQLLGEMTRRYPSTRLAITQTGADTPPYRLRTPDGHLALAQAIATSFPRYLGAADGRGKDPDRVRAYYEERIDDPGNPVYHSLASQYAQAIRRAGSRNLLLQNINPITAVLKAEEFGYLDASGLGRLNLTGVVHDISGAQRRFDYLRRRIERTGHSVWLIAVSDAVRATLVAAGIPSRRVATVVNGLDVHGFQDRVNQARAGGVFEVVRRRNQLPAAGRMILMSARRVAWKGHHDLVEAVAILASRGLCEGVYVAINGHGLIDTRDPDYEHDLAKAIIERGLADRVFLLDDLTPDEVTACYGAAHVTVLPSRLPEAFGYANIEAMLAGVPVVTTAHGGPLSYIDHERSGLLVNPADPVALADALQRLLTDPELQARIAAAGQSSARRFSVESMFDGYAKVLAAHPGAGR
ncbi:glycosyltransferase family 4 protein [Micromonospora matsumotoense]|uniref:glycosyltransferase family 4 protein n=1 Tax=Micromonospora matsumotoense TaxID=121616 RepID=UPI00340A6084